LTDAFPATGRGPHRAHVRHDTAGYEIDLVHRSDQLRRRTRGLSLPTLVKINNLIRVRSDAEDDPLSCTSAPWRNLSHTEAPTTPKRFGTVRAPVSHRRARGSRGMVMVMQSWHDRGTRYPTA
jgi:hypothetical protein